jgi:hypothetical protein
MRDERGPAFLAAMVAAAACGGALAGPDFKPFEEVSKDFEQVVSTADGKKPLYPIWLNKKTNQLLAELPSGWQNQKHLFAITQVKGAIFAGLQGPAEYVYWKRFDTRMALIAPELETRSQGEPESQHSVGQIFTDRVLADVAIETMGPGGQPVIDLDDLLLTKLPGMRGLNARLATVVKAKAFPENVEIEIEAPGADGAFVSFHFSVSRIPDNTGYKPREADERIGYFTTVFRDLGTYDQEKKWVRYIDRWHLEKRDPKLRVSPPKEPIVYYVDHTVPVRYRRWIRRGIEYWNEAFRTVGLDGAIEVLYQDKTTGAHMEKDPEDCRYNFIRWLNNDISTAIGPHRAHPLTGQILDADVVLTDGWIRAYWGWFYEEAPELAVEGFSAETLQWLDANPQWDPRVLLARPEDRPRILAQRAERQRRIAAGEIDPAHPLDPALEQNEELAAIGEWVGPHRQCLAAHGLAFDMSFARLNLELLAPEALEEFAQGAADTLDGIPEWFVGPLLAELVSHEVGHTLGLRHNFKSSSTYTLAEINSDAWKGKKPLAGSVMDYLPPNFNVESGEVQGDFSMITIGPYDRWAIEYGYTFDDLKKVLERVAEPELAYLTDDDTGGPDPLARRYDFSAEPLDYAENQLRLLTYHRGRILDQFVKDGDSWSKARRGYQNTLGMQTRMLSMMANWVGGAHVNRDRKGDPNGRPPLQVVPAEKQRAALRWVIDHAFEDAAFGLSPQLLAHMTVDKWSDQSPGDRGESTWPVHDRVASIQASTLTMIMNPSTLRRVYDNEFCVERDQDCLTLPEVLQTMMDNVYRELGTDLDGTTFTDRAPMVSSLRRGLQATMTERLIALAAGDSFMPQALPTLARHHLRVLSDSMAKVLEKKEAGQIDAYTLSHLEDQANRVEKALNRIYVESM